jgi:hypothetical protein
MKHNVWLHDGLTEWEGWLLLVRFSSFSFL